MMQSQSQAAGPGLPQVLLVPVPGKAEEAFSAPAQEEQNLTLGLSRSSIPSGTPVFWMLLPTIRVGLPSSGTVLSVRHLWELPHRHTQRYALLWASQSSQVDTKTVTAMAKPKPTKTPETKYHLSVERLERSLLLVGM